MANLRRERVLFFLLECEHLRASLSGITTGGSAEEVWGDEACKLVDGLSRLTGNHRSHPKRVRCECPRENPEANCRWIAKMMVLKPKSWSWRSRAKF